MFPQMEMDGESFVLRPMNCPHHMMIYANKLHSYKNLPIRFVKLLMTLDMKHQELLKVLKEEDISVKTMLIYL